MQSSEPDHQPDALSAAAAAAGSSLRRFGMRRVLALSATVLVSLAACGSPGDQGASATVAAPAASTEELAATTSVDADGLWDSSLVHSISVTYDEVAYDAMIAAFTDTGDKEWIEATVVIDGVEYRQVGLRLKGNSTLRGLTSSQGGSSAVSADDPASLPWLIRLDKYVDGQSHEGTTDLVVRANSSATALNEAVALELVGVAGLATQEAVPTRFTVNGGDAVLRLTIENPDDEWEDDNFDTDGVLYKAEASGDWSYRGDDAAAYDDVFEQESDTDNENLTPLIEFLDFINNSTDAEFAADLEDHLDVDAFATYLAVQELIDNFDDIDGPGNNAYLHVDSDTGRFTVVTWDLNLAFGASPAGSGRGGDGGAMPAGGPPAGATRNGAPGGGVPGGGGPAGKSNVLVQRFNANTEFAALVQSKLTELRARFYTSGTAQEILDRLTATLVEQAGDLVDSSTVSSEAASLATKFS